MSSIIQRYEYDIFISYRHNDNLDGWVSDFVLNLEKELKGTIKGPISIYFDTNPHDGLLEMHNVEKSLERKLKCLIFIPIISRTYCDTKSYAWQNEFCAFNNLAMEEEFGMDINLANGNVTSRILPIKIHDIDKEDSALLERELGGVLRAIEFFHKTSGVNRPLTSRDDEVRTPGKILYHDQVNKVANAIQEILRGIKNKENTPVINESLNSKAKKLPFRKKLRRRNLLRTSLAYILIALVLWKALVISSNLLNLKENTIQLFTLIEIILFPFAMLLAWFFERSPQGIIRTNSVDSLENIFSDGQKKPFTSIGIILLFLVITIVLMANAYSEIGEKEKALETIETALRIFPHKDYLIRNADRIFVELGEYKKAINLFEKELSTKDLHVLQAEILAPVGIAYYKTGIKSKSADILNELLSRNRNFARNEASFSAAQIYAAMGEKDNALLNLDKAYNRHEISMVNLKTDPGFKVLHGDPRFENLLLKIGPK